MEIYVYDGPGKQMASIPGASVVSDSERNGLGGRQLILAFGNGYGLSVVHGPGTYGVEAATIRFEDVTRPEAWDFAPLYSRDGIHGYMSRESLSELAARVAAEAPALTGCAP